MILRALLQDKFFPINGRFLQSKFYSLGARPPFKPKTVDNLPFIIFPVSVEGRLDQSTVYHLGETVDLFTPVTARFSCYDLKK